MDQKGRRVFDGHFRGAPPREEAGIKETLRPGIEHEFRFRVSKNKTVPALYPESPEFRRMPEVFATGFMVGLLEWACVEAINPYLDLPTEQTLGTHVDVSHTAATPIGLDVTVRVRLTEVDRRRLRFEVEAHDGVDLVTKGTHERFVIDRERFDARMEGKKKLARGEGCRAFARREPEGTPRKGPRQLGGRFSGEHGRRHRGVVEPGETECHGALFDAHLHIIDPRFPLVPNKGYLPEAFTVEDYLQRVGPLGVTGGAVVSSSFQGFDQGYLLDALEKLGPSFVGVANLPASVSDKEVLRLDAVGVRAVRFNLYRGGSADLADLERLARRVHELAGWHAELYVDSKDLPELEGRLAALPGGVSVDHLGMTREGYPALLRLVEGGMKVKATGFGRVGGDLKVAEALRKIADVEPTALMFGTDLPGTRAERPFEETDVGLVVETLGEELAELALFENGAGWYTRAGRKRW